LERFGERLLAERASRAEPKARDIGAYRRMYFSRAEPADIDGQGRILIPDRLAEHMGLRREVLLIGAFDHLELWDRQRWLDYTRRYAAQFDATAEGVLQEEQPH
jgi:MraZ protein